MMYEVSPLIMEEFHKYDLDSSGFIDPQEFVNIALDLKMDTNAVSHLPRYPSDLLVLSISLFSD